MAGTVTGKQRIPGLNPQSAIRNPQSEAALPFPAVIGQVKVRQQLFKILASGRLAHAYLFVGPAGSGRAAMALELARVLNCPSGAEKSAFEECNCNSCRQIRRWQHPNLLPLFPLPRITKKADEEKVNRELEKILAARADDPYAPLKLSGSGQILIEHIRDFRRSLSLAPDRPGVRTAIIQPADQMTEESANALLKHLEEPPDRCCLLLIAQSTRGLLPTIVSRCQVVRFAPLSVEQLTEALIRRRSQSDKAAESAARLASGSYARSMALSEGGTTDNLEDGLEFLRTAAVGNALKLTAFIDSWTAASRRLELAERLSYITVWLRDALIWKSFGPDKARTYLQTAGQESVIGRMAARYEEDQLDRVWQEIEETRISVGDNANMPLALMTLALKIHRILR